MDIQVKQTLKVVIAVREKGSPAAFYRGNPGVLLYQVDIKLQLVIPDVLDGLLSSRVSNCMQSDLPHFVEEVDHILQFDIRLNLYLEQIRGIIFKINISRVDEFYLHNLSYQFR